MAPADRHASRIDCAIGWFECDSAAAARESSALPVNPFAGSMRTTRKTPCVRVPVLSNTTVRTAARVSRAAAPFTRMPWRDAPPMPPKYPSGTLTMSAHGHEMTSMINAR